MFDRIYCVNLKRRPDRWDKFVSQFGVTDLDRLLLPRCQTKIQRWEAVDGKKVPPPKHWKAGGGAWGCYQSHLEILQKCLMEEVDSVLILEDDAVFPPDFDEKFTSFIDHLPSDWGMIYLGGQHLYPNKHQPIKINEWVYRPYNVNRTHAFALRGEMIRKVYRHLHTNDWVPNHHIDHHLGRLHQRREDPIYCPKEWIIGQAEGRSNISGRNFDEERFWKDAESIAECDPETQPFVAVMGLHSSGSSCLAGVLYHLGLHLGNTLGGYYGSDPGRNCGYEAQGLMDLCEKAAPFPEVKHRWEKGKIWRRLKQWINARRREAYEHKTIAAGKYPQLCTMSNQLRSICGDQLRIIMIHRPVEESIESMIRRTNKPSHQIRAHQEWLEECKLQTMRDTKDNQLLHIQYPDLLSDPSFQVSKICQFLDLDPKPETIDLAIRSVNPEKRHVNHSQTA